MSSSTETENAFAHLAAGLRDAGVQLITNHPGFRSNELLDVFYGQVPFVTSASERTAYSIAWGHAIGGKRAASAFKNVGLNDAADAFLNSLNLDLNAGMVCFVFDDTDVEHSQVYLDSRHYQAFYGGIWLEPLTLSEARSFVPLAFELSEEFSQPVVVRITNSLLSRGGYIPKSSEPKTQERKEREFPRNPTAWVAHPQNYAARAAARAERDTAIQEWSEEFCEKYNEGLSRGEGLLHVVAGLMRIPPLGEGEGILKIPCLPLPMDYIRSQAVGGRAIKVHEHGDAVVSRMVEAGLGGVKVEHERLHGISQNTKYHCRDHLAPVFATLRSFPDPVIAGDLGGYTMDPAQSIDVCLCYGASIAIATGIAVARPQSTVSCVTGDGAFLHAGKASIAEAIARGCRLLIIVLNNGGCQGTGGQLPPGDTSIQHPDVYEMEWQYDESDAEATCMILRAMHERPEKIRVLQLETDF